MTIEFEKKIVLYNSQSLPLIPKAYWDAGVFYTKIDMAGNSLLSTIFVEDIGAGGSVKIDYFDFTTGLDVGELNELKSHIIIDTSITSDKILVTNSHDKIVMKVTITGNPVKFSVYGTVVSNSVSDLDAALKKDAEEVNFVLDKSVPVAGLDRLNGLWRFLSTDETGSLYVKTNDQVGNPFYHEIVGLTESGIEKEFISHTVQSGKARKLTKFKITSRETGLYRIYKNSVIIGSGRLNPNILQDVFEWIPSREITAGETYRVTFETFAGRPNKDVEVYLMGNETDI